MEGAAKGNVRVSAKRHFTSNQLLDTCILMVTLNTTVPVIHFTMLQNLLKGRALETDDVKVPPSHVKVPPGHYKKPHQRDTPPC